MKDHALQIARSMQGENARRNALREYLQAYLLRLLFEGGFFRHCAFLGGTSLRFLYGLPRFSEDLDFSLEHRKEYSFEQALEKVKTGLEKSGYEISVSYKEEKTVQYALFKFGDLLYGTGLSRLKGQKFSVKLEVDTRPPAGAAMQHQLAHKFFPVTFLVYDLPSLFAGKLTALLCRKFTKGRDYFDLGWYLAKWRDLIPNIPMLRNGVRQMSWAGPLPDENSWRGLIREKVETSDWKTVTADVRHLLEDPLDIKILSKENILSLLT